MHIRVYNILCSFVPPFKHDRLEYVMENTTSERNRTLTLNGSGSARSWHFPWHFRACRAQNVTGAR